MNYTDIVGYCIYCKDEIKKGTKYLVDEKEDYYHYDCYKLIEDNADYFGRD